MKRKQLTEEHKRNISNALKKLLQNDLDFYTKRVQQLNRVTKNAPYKSGWISVLGLRIYYRSSYELEGLLFLDLHKDNIKYFASEKLNILYIDKNNKNRITIPDWEVVLKDESSYIIEIKPSSKLIIPNTDIKIQATGKWCTENNKKYCIWNEEILRSFSSTTMSLKEILEATVTHQNGGRYSLNSSVMERIGKKLPNRLLLQESIKIDDIPINYCACGCGEIASPKHKYCRGHNRKGRKLTEEHKANISKGGLGHITTLETRQKISAAKKGKASSPEHYEMLSRVLTGRKKSREAVLKMINTNKQKYASGERIPWNKGKHYRHIKNRSSSNS